MLRKTWIGALLLLAAMACVASRFAIAETSLPRIVTHDNRTPAGTLNNGVLRIDLEITKGEWYPEAEDGPHISVYAFAEAGKAPEIPGPLLRVADGTRVEATVKNRLDQAMVLHGFMPRPGDDVPVTIAPGEVKRFSFNAGRSGTYFYWAGLPTSTMGIGSTRYAEETELSGAFVVDGKDTRPDDRVFVIGMWRDYVDRENPKPTELREFGTINGKAWPYTERLSFRIGEPTIWHWINATPIIHPMHMHGSYYEVLSRGDWQRDVALKPELRPQVVTDLMQPGRTFTMQWTPAEPGHWLFHCHLMAHLEPRNSLSALQQRSHGHEMHSGMVGLVLAVDVEGKAKKAIASSKRRRKLELDIEAIASSPLQVRLELHEGKNVAKSTDLLGPAIVLHRGEPTSITVVNHLSEPTSIHWHGMELESYYDGVPGMTGMGKRMTPTIPPGGKFVVRMTPVRSGTFIYHTHWHDVEQLRGGLTGALVVAGDRYDAASEQIFVTSFGPDDNAPLLLNGAGKPAPLHWVPGKTYRVRFINIGPSIPVKVSLSSGGNPLKWKSTAKDGMELPEIQRTEGAAAQLVAVGETYDFEVKAPDSGEVIAQALIAANRGITPERKAEQIIRLQAADPPVVATRK